MSHEATKFSLQQCSSERSTTSLTCTYVVFSNIAACSQMHTTGRRWFCRSNLNSYRRSHTWVPVKACETQLLRILFSILILTRLFAQHTFIKQLSISLMKHIYREHTSGRLNNNNNTLDLLLLLVQTPPQLSVSINFCKRRNR